MKSIIKQITEQNRKMEAAEAKSDLEYAKRQAERAADKAKIDHKFSEPSRPVIDNWIKKYLREKIDDAWQNYMNETGAGYGMEAHVHFKIHPNGRVEASVVLPEGVKGIAADKLKTELEKIFTEQTVRFENKLTEVFAGRYPIKMNVTDSSIIIQHVPPR